MPAPGIRPGENRPRELSRALPRRGARQHVPVGRPTIDDLRILEVIEIDDHGGRHLAVQRDVRADALEPDEVVVRRGPGAEATSHGVVVPTVELGRQRAGHQPGRPPHSAVAATGTPGDLDLVDRCVCGHGAVVGPRGVDHREEVDRAQVGEPVDDVGDPHRVATADRPRKRLGHDQRPHAYMLSYSRSPMSDAAAEERGTVGHAAPVGQSGAAAEERGTVGHAAPVGQSGAAAEERGTVGHAAPVGQSDAAAEERCVGR